MLLPKHERSFNDRGQSFGNISGLNGYKFWGRTVSNLIRPKGVYELVIYFVDLNTKLQLILAVKKSN